MNRISTFLPVCGLCLSKNQSVAGKVTEENILEGSVTIWLMMPSSIIFLRISYSLLPASEAEFAMTSAALPCSFRAVAK